MMPSIFKEGISTGDGNQHPKQESRNETNLLDLDGWMDGGGFRQPALQYGQEKAASKRNKLNENNNDDDGEKSVT